MLDLVEDKTRNLIAMAHRIAYCGNLNRALQLIEEHLKTTSLADIDRAAVLSTKSELLFLDKEFKASHQVFSLELEPLLKSLPHNVAIVIEFNRSNVAFASIDSDEISRYQNLVDEMRFAGIRHQNDSDLLHASKQAARGQSYDSLPTFWRELVRTYKQGHWSSFRNASCYMAEECIRLQEFADAAFHASIAENSEIAKQIAKSLVDSRKPKEISKVLEKLMTTANLRSHFNIACEFIQEATDIVPNDFVDRLIRWILPRCKRERDPEDHGASEKVAWNTIKAIASRSTEEMAQKIIITATKHPAWKEIEKNPNKLILNREEIIDAVYQTVPASPEESLPVLADLAIPLATDRKNSQDYAKTLNLLGRIVSYGPESVSKTIRDALFPKGQGIYPALMQLAPHFGYEILNTNNQLDNYAKKIITDLNNVVQQLPKGTQPIPVNGPKMTWHSVKEHEIVYVHYLSLTDLHAMASNRKNFSPESIRDVIRALSKSISDPENVLANKYPFIDCIKRFADVLDRNLANDLFEVLAPIAEGRIELTGHFPDIEQQNHPLSVFRFNGVTLNQVVGHALFILSCIEYHLPDVFGDRLLCIVEKSLSSSSPEIRKSAFAAVREIPTISESTWVPVIMGMQDPNTNAAALAFDAIVNKNNATLTRPQWRMVTYALKTAQSNSSILLRRAAADALSTLKSQAPNRKIANELEEIQQLFASDIAYSVRNAAKVNK
ncbi:hypothetical protein [Gimesia aquarii]|uniref:Uncharacterized protein n=1 Tax=Gimesia aquarii TaxID=2527964 RepID=A0A517WW62_9PLAN|nr:hypothetical protein [Gimesia aquarii]QDU09468.1 hypothetical protein V202x_28430 [Gimesia aquarii]